MPSGRIVASIDEIGTLRLTLLPAARYAAGPKLIRLPGLLCSRAQPLRHQRSAQP